MTPRLPVGELVRGHHGGVDVRRLESAPLQEATDRLNDVIEDLAAVDRVVREYVRLRNAYHQKCHL